MQKDFIVETKGGILRSSFSLLLFIVQFVTLLFCTDMAIVTVGDEAVDKDVNEVVNYDHLVNNV